MRKKTLLAAAAVVVFALGAVTGCGSSADIGRDAALETALNDAGVNEADTTRLSVAEDKDDGRKIYDIQFNAGGKEYDYEIQASDGRILSSEVDTASSNAAGSDDSGLGSALVPDNSTQDSTAQSGGDSGSSDGTGSGQNSADNSSSGTATDGQTQDNSQSQNTGNSGNTNSSGSSQGNSQNGNSSSGNSNVALSIDDAISIALGRVSGATEQNIKIKLDHDDGRYIYEGEIRYNNREYEFEIDANSGTILEWSEERD